MLRSPCRQLVSTYPAIRGRNAPLGFYQLFVQKSLESWIERAFFNLKQIIGRSLNVLRERVPVQRLPLQRLENHHLQCARKQVSLLAVFHEEVLSRLRLN